MKNLSPREAERMLSRTNQRRKTSPVPPGNNDVAKKKQPEQLFDPAEFPEQNPFPIGRIAEDGTILYANPKCRLFLDDWNVSIGQRVPKFLAKIVKTVLRTQENHQIEISIQDKMFAFIVTFIPSKPYVNLYGMDITDRKKYEEHLKKDREELDQLVRQRTQELIATHDQLERAKHLSDIGQLAATVAHELRNPLAAIQFAVANIRRKRENPLIDSNLANIEKKVEESEAIIKNLLYYARIKTPQFNILNIHSLLKECLDSLKSKCKNQDITISVDIGSVKNFAIEGDAHQLTEVFENIFNNAYDAVGHNGTIKLSAAVDDNRRIRVSVEDNGIGIPEHVFKRIFEPFFSTKTKGIGLGLAVCRQIVQMHNGSIEIRNNPQKGVTANITLPLKNEKPRQTAGRNKP